ncbi:MAG: family 10 glycosylhydrolase [Phycisphaerae bacterium]|nr:family 10 glycosylhydrolase [Phycisphaerae bacterium]
MAYRLGSTTGLHVGFALAALAVGLQSPPAPADEYRAFWVDAWGPGFRSQSEVETLLGKVGDPANVGRIREANCNAVIVQVRRRADVCYPSAVGEPYMSDLSPWNFNALQAMIDAAHDTTGGKQRIEVHCWLVTFATGKSGSAGVVYQAHCSTPTGSLITLDNYWPTRDQNGAETDDKAFDPGHPLVLKYTTDVCMDMVNNFNVDGVHFDYIRFTGNSQGYNPTSIARYNARYGLTGQPASTDERFKQWRRDQVTAVVRRVYAHIQQSKPQVRLSGAFVTWNPSPTTSTREGFRATRPYYDVYSDWDSWIQEGIVDMAVPMTYYNWGGSLAADYTRWMNFEKDRKGDRHMVVGPGIYMNSLDNAIYELQMTRNASPAGNHAHGFCGYSYRAPFTLGSSYGPWTDFAPRLLSDVTPVKAAIPDMPWKSSPTKAHLMGTVTLVSSGAWADGATVGIAGPESRSMATDGTGFYAFIDLTPGTYQLTASKAGYPDLTATVSVALGAVTGNMYEQDFSLGGNIPPVISEVNVTALTDHTASITWTTDTPGTSQVEYGTTTSYGAQTPLDATRVTRHAVTLAALEPNTRYHFRVMSANDYGPSTSADFTLATDGPPEISDIKAASVAATEAVITWTTNAASTSQVRYGLTGDYGSQSLLDPTRLTSHFVTLTGLTPLTAYHYQVVSTNDYGSRQSADLTFATPEMPTEYLIDNTDSGWANTSPSGNWTVGVAAAVPRIGVNYLYTSGVGNTDEWAATRKCTWTPNLALKGYYDVYVYYQIGSNRSNSAPYQVHHQAGTLTSVQNQNSSSPNQSGWFLIGQDLLFLAGTSGYVELGNNTADTRYVSADAAKFVFKSPFDVTPPSTPVVTDEGACTLSTSVLSVTWTTADAESAIARSEYRIVQLAGPTVRDWTDVGTQTQVTATDLTLLPGRSYRVQVRATNDVGLASEIGASDGIVVFGFDVDGNTLVNASDMNTFQQCLAGPEIPYPSTAAPDCGRFDTDSDNDVDMSDFAVFQRCLTGPDPIDPNCVKP